MRLTLAGSVLGAVVLALVAAALVGLGHGPPPDELDASLVGVREDQAGQPLIEVEDVGDGALADVGAVDGRLLVRPDQFICRGGSLTDLVPGLPVLVTGPSVVDGGDVDGAPVVTADLVLIECG